MNLLIATKNGFAAAEKADGGWHEVRRGLNGRFLTSIIAREGVILVGTRDGVFRSDDGGASWGEASRGLTQRHLRWLAFHPDISDLEFAGTEPAAIFVSRDGGESWQERPEVAEWREQFGWWLPYSPQDGCVRGFAVHGPRVYAAVEVGAALRSDDYGESWQLVAGSDGRPRFGTPAPGALHPDVHSIAVHPDAADWVFAPTGGGFYLSRDGGESWTHRYGDYVRAVWADPDDADHLIIGPAINASGQNGHIAETHDGGDTWRPISPTWNRNMVERFLQVEDRLFAVMARGELLVTPLSDFEWQRILPDVGHVTAVTVFGDR